MSYHIKTDSKHQDLCCELRSRAILALESCILNLKIGETSEVNAQQILAKELRRLGITEYWYPAGEEGPLKRSQFGIVVVFHTERQPPRMGFQTARTLEVLKDVTWDRLGYFYMSPHQSYCTESQLKGAWGDAGVSVYIGSDERIKTAFKLSWRLGQEILTIIRTNPNKMKTSAVYRVYMEIAEKLGITNVAETRTGPRVGKSRTNIGHTFPNLGIPLSENPTSQSLIQKMANNRVFIDNQKSVKLTGGIWTLESRDRHPNLAVGAISFHRAFSLKDGSFRLLPDYADFFRKVGMKWILE